MICYRHPPIATLLCRHHFPWFSWHLASRIRVHSVVNMAGVVKTLWRSNSLSRSVISIVGSFGFGGSPKMISKEACSRGFALRYVLPAPSFSSAQWCICTWLPSECVNGRNEPFGCGKKSPCRKRSRQKEHGKKKKRKKWQKLQKSDQKWKKSQAKKVKRK